MSSATVTSKGQITVPIEVRRRLGLHPGTRVDFIESGANSYEIRVRSTSIKDLQGVIPAPKHPVTLDEMDESIAAGAAATLG